MARPPSGNNNQGFIMSTILVVGLVASVIGAALIILGLEALRNAGVNVNKYKTLALNNACAEESLFLINQTPGYTCSGCSLTIDNQTCNYDIENIGGDNRRVKTKTTIRNVTGKTLVELTVNSSGTISIISWEEVTDLP